MSWTDVGLDGEKMKAIVYADRRGDELLPLTGKTPVALLPVIGKPVLEHTLEDLAEAGVRSVLLVVRAEARDAFATLGAGERWGLNLKTIIAAPDETPTDVARRCAGLLPDTFLALRGDVMRGRVVRDFLAASSNVLAAKVVAEIQGRAAQLCLSRKRDLQLDGLHWSEGSLDRAAGRWRTRELGNAGLARLTGVTDYYLANMDALDRCFAGLAPAGRQIKAGVFSGQDAEVTAESVRDGMAVFGAKCHVSSDTELHGPLVIGGGAVIGAGVFMHACVVMRGASVPGGTRLGNAVVTSDMAIGLDGRMLVRFTDLLAESNAA
jgi:NDP-sugar pyrophosphorylase family protein